MTKRVAAAAAVAFALVAGTARADGGNVLGFTVSMSAPPSAATTSLPSAVTPNSPGSISVPVSFTSPPPSPHLLSLPQLQSLWRAAGAAYGIPWQVLAAINKIESNFGQNMGPSSAGAIGWMQFMPDTWLRWGVDANGDGIADPWNATDAVYAAARYLAAAGGQSDVARAVFSYNHADWYVNEVLQLAKVYGEGGAPTDTGASLQQVQNLQQLQAALDRARGQVVAANAALVAAVRHERALAIVSRRLHAKVGQATLLSDRLAAERRSVLFDVRVSRAQNVVGEKRASLGRAQSALQTAQQRAAAPSFAPGSAPLLGGPSYENGYVFPVGGGPSLVSAAHTHHDYPAVDIAAPEGSPVYALASSTVLNEWNQPDPRCGIGLTLRAYDGQVWTYCHLAYLAPAVLDGVRLQAGQEIGLVGHTGDATGPHLHLQLQPPTAWPQQEAWFQGFAGRAFRWQDAPTPLEPAAARVFQSAAEGDSGPVIAFTRPGA
jgi:murein DD-endopeptidase MepM/ murein hydrolase activator NlpD